MPHFPFMNAVAFGARVTSTVAALAVGLSMPVTARSQALCPGLDARQGARTSAALTGAEDRRFTTAYGRFVQRADRGDAAAASAALFMLRNGKALFGSDWSATEGQQVRWNALAVNAARYHLPVVSNDADD